MFKNWVENLYENFINENFSQIEHIDVYESGVLLLTLFARNQKAKQIFLAICFHGNISTWSLLKVQTLKSLSSDLHASIVSSKSLWKSRVYEIRLTELKLPQKERLFARVFFILDHRSRDFSPNLKQDLSGLSGFF